MTSNEQQISNEQQSSNEKQGSNEQQTFNEQNGSSEPRESTKTQSGVTHEGSGLNELADAAGISFLNRENASFYTTEGGMLAVKVGESEHSGVYVHSSFPHSNQTEYLSIRTHENKEIGMVRNLDDVDTATAELLRQQLQIRYFAPQITRLIKVKEEFGYSYWETETDSGICRFTVRGGVGQIKLVTPVRLLITDVDGNRFIIPDYTALSDKEFKMIELHM
ncbi:DUF1854 domain-containing protein [Paenibacillus sp. CAU 1782]